MARHLARTFGLTVYGIEGSLVEVEVDISTGLPSFDVVGLPDAAVREARERVRSAIRNSGFEFPVRRITVSLAPAGRRKEGPGLDLPIALGILAAAGEVPAGAAAAWAGLGELALDGAVRPVRGALAMAIAARRAGRRQLLVAPDSAGEAALAAGLSVHGVPSLRAAVTAVSGRNVPPPAVPATAGEAAGGGAGDEADLTDVRGMDGARRALEVAAAGAHNLLLIGPPGTGKTMLSRRLPGILPPLAGEEALDVTMIHGIAGLLPPGAGLVAARPFRAPHHCASSAALVGGGRPPRPGEVTLAHHGVLFLDELAEFRRESLEALRTQLEDGQVTVSRLNSAAVFPAAFMLVAAMNPCPCGWLGDPVRPCRCSPDEVERYRGRISGPLLDRIDVVVEVRRPAYAELAQPRAAPNTSSAAVRARVAAARRLQHARASAAGIVAPRPNATLAAREVERLCQPDAAGERLLAAAFDRLGLSPRARERILKVARTIADLDGAQTVGAAHVAEAIQYRALDRGRP